MPYDAVGTGPAGLYANDVVRWQYRFKENKSRFNRATKAFANGTYQSYLIATSPWNHIVNGKLVDNHRVNFNWIDNAVLCPLRFLLILMQFLVLLIILFGRQILGILKMC